MNAHLKAVEALLTTAFPVSVVRHIGIRTDRIGTEADLLYGHDSHATLGGRISNLTPILYPYELLGNSSWNLENLGISPETTSRTKFVTGRGAMKQFNEYTVLDEVHFSSEVRSSHDSASHALSSQSSWQTHTILGDTLRFCPVGPLPPHPSDVESYNIHCIDIGLKHSSGTRYGRTETAFKSLFPNRDVLKHLHLPPLLAPRLNPGRMSLDTLVLLPGYESKDLPKLVKANLLKHMSRLDDRDLDSGNPGKHLAGFQRSQLLPPEDLLAHYGVRVLSDCVEIALEADVSYLILKHQTQHESRNGMTNKKKKTDIENIDDGVSFTEKKMRERRTVYIGFANPNWSLQTLNNSIEEPERAARRVACGFSRETLRRSLPSPIIEASRLLAQHSRRILKDLPPPNSEMAGKYQWLPISPTFWLNQVLDVSKIPRSEPNPVIRDCVLAALSHFAPPPVNLMYQWGATDEKQCPTMLFEQLSCLAAEGQEIIPHAESRSMEKKATVPTQHSLSLSSSPRETNIEEMRRLRGHLLEWTLLSGHAYVPDGFPPSLFSTELKDINASSLSPGTTRPYHLEAPSPLSCRSDRIRPYSFPNIISGRRENMLIAAALADEVVKVKMDKVRHTSLLNSNLLPSEIFMSTRGPTREILRSLGKVVAVTCQNPPNFMSEVFSFIAGEEEKKFVVEEYDEKEEVTPE